MEDKMTVLMTTDTVGGVWVYSLELCKALREYDVEIHLAAMGTWPSDDQQAEVAQLSNTTLYKSDYKLEWMEDPWEDVERARKWINSIYHTIKPDLIHLNNYAHVGEDWEGPTISVFHSCVQTWWQAVKGTSAPETWKHYTEVVKSSLEDSDVVVSPSRAILEKAQQTHGFSTESQVIYNGRDLEFPEQMEKEKFIFCTGRIWDEGKNLMLLAKVARHLPWPVYVAGNNTNPSTGQRVDIENIHFLGTLSQIEMKDWLKRASIFVSPTKYEPFGLAILEAAEAGCALALSDLDTLQEIWEDSARFFDPTDRKQAQEAMLELIESEEKRSAYAAKALARSRNYTAKKMGDAYYELYHQCLKNNMESKLTSA